MKKKNIYVNQSQELLRLFEEAGNGANIMCVPIDYAKKDHVAMFCDGYGHILRKPFPVKNSPEGIEYVMEHSLIGDNPILFLSRRKMYQKEIKENNRLQTEGVFGQTSPVPESQVFDGEILTEGKFCA